MVFSTAYGSVLILPMQEYNIDPVVKLTLLAILVLMLFLNALT
jgi:hypothetical protein